MRKGFFIMAICLLFFWGNANATTFVSGSTGADGAFSPPTQVPTGTVIDGNTATVPLPADGIFNFTTVNIPSGVTVTFKKNAANTPIYILATGNVTIAGTININGGSTSYSPCSREPGKGGPGGYDGGYGGISGISGAGGQGLGPGGGGAATYYAGGGGGFGTNGGTPKYCAVGGASYGNSKLMPLIGGSGGGGSTSLPSNCVFTNSLGYGGGGGGGAILIASSGNITISGSITANGGYANNCGCIVGGSGYFYFGGGGSGGAIRLIANNISGSGTISAKGGDAGSSQYQGNNTGGAGRIRIEAYTNNFASSTNPSYSFGLPSSVFVPNQPSMSITSIGGVAVPSSPTGSYSAPDITFPSTTTNPVAVTLSATNIPVGTTVTVSVIPQQGSASNVNTTLSGTDASSTASANVNLSIGSPYIISAQTTFTLQTAMFYDGEKIEKVRVASTMGKGSEVTYITESGKEIPAEKLMAKL